MRAAMRLSNLADYAVVLMGAVARHCGEARVSSATLAAETGVPAATAQKLVHRLTRAGLLRAVRGSGGGVKLTRPAAAISLADIVEAIEGPIAMTGCTKSGDCGCVIAPACVVKPHMLAANDAVRGALAGINLMSIAR
jgi:Rrf2 family protein